MNEIQSLQCEIDEYKKQLESHRDSIKRLDRFIKDKESEIYYHNIKAGKGTLKQILSEEGYMNDICNVVYAFLPDKIDYEPDDLYSQGWNDCIEYMKGRIK